MITKQEIKNIYIDKFLNENWCPAGQEATTSPMIECVDDFFVNSRCERYLKIKYNKKVSIYLKFEGYSTLERFIRVVEVDATLKKEIGQDYFKL